MPWTLWYLWDDQVWRARRLEDGGDRLFMALFPHLDAPTGVCDRYDGL